MLLHGFNPRLLTAAWTLTSQRALPSISLTAATAASDSGCTTALAPNTWNATHACSADLALFSIMYTLTGASCCCRPTLRAARIMLADSSTGQLKMPAKQPAHKDWLHQKAKNAIRNPQRHELANGHSTHVA